MDMCIANVVMPICLLEDHVFASTSPFSVSRMQMTVMLFDKERG